MVTFAALAAQQMQSVAKQEPYVLAGDWNFDPASSCYELLTTGRLDVDHPDFPCAPRWAHGRPSKWTPAVARMRSAYALARGKEPELTNHACTRKQGSDGDTEGRTFTATLDYIFLSRHWEQASDCAPTPTLEGLRAIPSFPTRDEPSDHALIACTLRT